MVLNDTSKRACIYFIYDRDGIIDDYILYQINDLRENVTFLHCVINGKLTPEGRERLEPLVDEIYVRENKGHDIGAYKAAVEYIGWKKLGTFDELVLMNNTCFGPVYPFKEVFDWAKVQYIVYWGLTWGYTVDWLGHNNYPHYTNSETHYQSYFLVVCMSTLFRDILRKKDTGAQFIVKVRISTIRCCIARCPYSKSTGCRCSRNAAFFTIIRIYSTTRRVRALPGFFDSWRRRRIMTWI